MRRCPRCDVVFQLEDRTRCLYCDSLLVRGGMEKKPADSSTPRPGTAEFYVGRFFLAKTLVLKLLKERGADDHGRMQFLVGSFFKTRTFSFMYRVSRQDYKMGKTYSRFLIQPLTAYSFLMVPWVIYDFFDSLFFRLTYNGYCPRCDSKFILYRGLQEHDPAECDYHREYAAIIRDVVTGKIPETEEKYKLLAEQKRSQGRRSAYEDLCGSGRVTASFMDVACIWISVLLATGVLVFFFLPKISSLFSRFNGEFEL